MPGVGGDRRKRFENIARTERPRESGANTVNVRPTIDHVTACSGQSRDFSVLVRDAQPMETLYYECSQQSFAVNQQRRTPTRPALKHTECHGSHSIPRRSQPTQEQGVQARTRFKLLLPLEENSMDTSTSQTRTLTILPTMSSRHFAANQLDNEPQTRNILTIAERDRIQMWRSMDAQLGRHRLQEPPSLRQTSRKGEPVTDAQSLAATS